MDSYGNDLPFALVQIVFSLTVLVVTVVGYWKINEKAKYPGWAAIVPIYNLYIILKIVGRPGWWLVLYFIPLVNLVIQIIVALDLARVFGRSGLFGFFLNFLFPIGPMIIGLGKSQYKGPSTPSSTPPASQPAPAVATPTTPPPAA